MCGTSAAPRQTPLREGLDDDLTGSHVTRDSLVSVMYSTELNSATSSVT